MALTFDFCVTRAEEAALAAEEAKLDNVRDIALRSEETWRKMAEQIKSVHDTRDAMKKERHTEQVATADWPSWKRS